ncbi:MAG: hypothetical protein E7016_07865 [Alphaproteobacteria bacterium]|nr:hypothetical protein [Alphaproteobacteria bacterium]
MRKICELGRSMVEMLGVLAIIGVLSVGGIAGYSKAMMKYKLNTHAENLNILINNMIQYRAKIQGSGNVDNESGYEQYGPVFEKLNLIPDAFKLSSYTDIYDNFGNRIWIYKYFKEDWIGMGLEIKPESGREICINIVKTAKENHADLRQINMQYNNSDGEWFTGIGALYGDKDCGGNKKCLRNLKLLDIDELCNVCDINKQTCTVYLNAYIN